jgi:starch synthase (maltosyl-transferring)
VPAISLGIRVADRRWRYRWVYRRWERAAAQAAQRVVSVSQSVGAFAQAELRLRDEQCLVIPNGIDVESFALAKPLDLTPFGLAPGERPVVFIGRLDPQKGADRLVELGPMLAALGVPLLIVGSGPLEASLRNAFAKQKQARVHFAGWQADIAGILQASRLLVLPSRFEGMPNVVLEAMAAGRPALVTPVEGTEELLGDHAFGQVLRWDRSLWSGGLGRFLTNDQLARETGQHNQARIREHFSLTGMVERYARLFSDLATRV